MCPEISIQSVCCLVGSDGLQVKSNSVQVSDYIDKTIYEALETYMQKEVTSLHTAIPESLLCESNSTPVFVIALIAIIPDQVIPYQNKVVAAIADVVTRNKLLSWMLDQVSANCIMMKIPKDKIDAVQRAHEACLGWANTIQINSELADKAIELCWMQWYDFQKGPWYGPTNPNRPPKRRLHNCDL